MLKIKLSRKGKKKFPIYRIVVLETGRDPYGDVLEMLGSYNPHTKELQINNDRVKHWMDHGAQLTDTINNLFIDKKVVEGKKVAVSKLGKKAKEAVAKKKAEEAALKAQAEKPVEAPQETPQETPQEPNEEVKTEEVAS